MKGSKDRNVSLVFCVTTDPFDGFRMRFFILGKKVKGLGKMPVMFKLQIEQSEQKMKQKSLIDLIVSEVLNFEGFKNFKRAFCCEQS